MNVIAFSVFGDHPKYWVGAERNIALASVYYPGWVCRFYVADRESEKARRLRDLGAQVENGDPNVYGTFWRHRIAFDEDVGCYIVRDSDSRISSRESTAVSEWLKASKSIVLLRDHPSHTYRFMCGLYGAIGYSLAKWMRMLPPITNTGWCADTKFYNEHLLPLIEGLYDEYDEFHHDVWPLSKQYPQQRVNFRFLGESFDEHDEPDQSWIMIRDALNT